jgi:hypothetical protein
MVFHYRYITSLLGKKNIKCSKYFYVFEMQGAYTFKKVYLKCLRIICRIVLFNHFFGTKTNLINYVKKALLAFVLQLLLQYNACFN